MKKEKYHHIYRSKKKIIKCPKELNKELNEWQIFYLKIILFFIFLIQSIFFINRQKSPKPSIKYKINLSSNQPKISVFLPIYNKENYLSKSIESILNQTMREIEIIAVNDGSTDNTYNILKSYAQKDSRIKIINNKKNRGLLYARAMGIINSHGEYLMNLDPDDSYNDPSDLQFLYDQTNQSQIDIIRFCIKKINTDKNKVTLCGCKNPNEILYHPKLYEQYIYKRDFLIWNKMVKREVYLKAFEALKDRIYGEKWNYGEDEVYSSLINKYAKSKKCEKRIVYVYIKNNFSLSKKKNKKIYATNLIFWNEVLLSVSYADNKNLINYQIKRFIFFIKTRLLPILKLNNILNKKYINYLSILKDKYKENNATLNSIIKLIISKKK